MARPQALKAFTKAQEKPQFPRSECKDWLVSVEIDGEQQTFPDYTGIAIEYCERVLDGRIDAGKLVKRACKRFLAMYERAKRPRCEFSWSNEWVLDTCSFVEKLPQVEAVDGPIELQPCQIFWLAAIYGFRLRDGRRLVREVMIVLPRKNGKSLLLAAMTLIALVLEDEPGPEIVIGASTLAQAGEVLDPARKIVMKDADLREHFALKVLNSKIECGLNAGAIRLVTSVASANDGASPHMVVLEELHAQKPGLYQVMSSAFGARRNWMLAKITTAGSVAAGLCWEQWKKAERLLTGQYRADSEFAIIYAADKEDRGNETDLLLIRKCNPMYGISLTPESVRLEVSRYVNDPNYRAEYLRTRLNQWSNAAEAIFDPDEWDDCRHEITPAMFKDFPAWIGVDLALRDDMLAVGLLFDVGDAIVGFVRYFIPEDSPYLADPDYSSTYQSWIEEKRVTLSGQYYIDLGPVGACIKDWHKEFAVKEIGVDPSHAMHFANELQNSGLPIVMIKNTAEIMSEPTDDLRVRVKAGLFRHDGNPVLAWNAQNVVGNRNTRDLILPKKESRNSPNKIDGIHALIFANALRMKGLESERKEADKPHPWAVRGLLGMDEPAEDPPEQQ